MSKIIGEEHEGISDNSFITRESEKPGYINICAGDKTSYQWAELKSSALVYFLNKNDDTHNQLVGYLHEIIHKVLSYLNKNIDIELQKYQEKIKTTDDIHRRVRKKVPKTDDICRRVIHVTDSKETQRDKLRNLGRTMKLMSAA